MPHSRQAQAVRLATRRAGGKQAMMSFIATHTRKVPASDPRCLHSERGDFTTRACDLFIKIFN